MYKLDLQWHLICYYGHSTLFSYDFQFDEKSPVNPFAPFLFLFEYLGQYIRGLNHPA